MDTVIVASSQFYSHFPRQIPKGSVNAEQVEIRLDKSWDGLTVFWHWKNLGTGVEKRDLLKDPAAPNDIPWEVLTDLGELRMGLVGMDGDTVIKPTIWLSYGYVSDGVDPESGSDPQPPTPSWEQQMVEQATQANQAAQAAQQAAEEAAKAVASAGPYAEQAKQSAEAAKASQDAAATSARQANEAAQTAQNAAGSIGDAVKRAEDAATAAGTAYLAAESAKDDAAQSAGTAQSAAVAAVQSAGTAQDAATKAGEYLSSAETAAGAATEAAVAAGKSQEAAQGAAQAAASARDQATTAATTADTAKDAAEQAATTAGNAQSGAAQSAQAAANSAQAAERAKQEAQNAAAAFPAPSPEVAGMVPMVNPDGDGYVFGKAGGGGLYKLLYSGMIEESDVMNVILSSEKPIKDIVIYVSTPVVDGLYSLQCYLGTSGNLYRIVFGIGNLFMTTKNVGVVFATLDKSLGMFTQTAAKSISAWYSGKINEEMYYAKLANNDEEFVKVTITRNQSGKTYPIPVGTEFTVGVRYE